MVDLVNATPRTPSNIDEKGGDTSTYIRVLCHSTKLSVLIHCEMLIFALGHSNGRGLQDPQVRTRLGKSIISITSTLLKCVFSLSDKDDVAGDKGRALYIQQGWSLVFSRARTLLCTLWTAFPTHSTMLTRVRALLALELPQLSPSPAIGSICTALFIGIPGGALTEQGSSDEGVSPEGGKLPHHVCEKYLLLPVLKAIAYMARHDTKAGKSITNDEDDGKDVDADGLSILSLHDDSSLDLSALQQLWSQGLLANTSNPAYAYPPSLVTEEAAFVSRTLDGGDMADPRGHYAQPGHGFWVAYLPGHSGPQLVGCVAIRPGKDSQTGDLGRLTVHPSYRGRGIGQALVRHVHQQVFSRSSDINLSSKPFPYTQITAITSSLNLSATSLYSRCGYDRTFKGRKDGKTGEPAFVTMSISREKEMRRYISLSLTALRTVDMTSGGNKTYKTGRSTLDSVSSLVDLATWNSVLREILIRISDNRQQAVLSPPGDGALSHSNTARKAKGDSYAPFDAQRAARNRELDRREENRVGHIKGRAWSDDEEEEEEDVGGGQQDKRVLYTTYNGKRVRKDQHDSSRSGEDKVENAKQFALQNKVRS